MASKYVRILCGAGNKHFLSEALTILESETALVQTSRRALRGIRK